MARYVLIAVLASNPVTFLYEDGTKALAKARTLQRREVAFEIREGSKDPTLTIEELEARLQR